MNAHQLNIMMKLKEKSNDETNGIPTYIKFLQKWMLNSLLTTKKQMEYEMKSFNVVKAFSILKKYFFNDFSDIYLESIKPYLFQHHYRPYRQEIYVGNILHIKNCSEDHKLTPKKDEDGVIIKNSKGRPVGYDKLDETEWVLKYYRIEEKL